MSLESMKERLSSLERRELVGLLVVGALVVGGAGLWYVRSLPRPVSIQTTAGGSGGASSGVGTGGGPSATPSPSPSPAVIVVDVAGFVNRPGVYEFHQGDRVIDAITRAGGARKGADLTSINLAALLTDGEQIVIAKRGAAPGGSSAGSGTTTAGGASGGAGALVNVNTATLDELETLPGIGEVLGQRIIDYREQHGPFQSVEDLLNVSGIGDSRLADIKPHVTV
jgi:competence protein ComEA